MSGAMARYPAAASASNWCRHEYQHSGKPWQRSTVGPLPASARCIRMPFVSINRCEIVIANLRKIQSHCELQPQPKWLRRHPVERRTAKTTCSTNLISSPHRASGSIGASSASVQSLLPRSSTHVRICQQRTITASEAPPDWPPTPAERALDSAHISPVQLIGEVRQPIPASSNATIANITATAPSISSSASTCIGPGARSRSPNGGRQKITPTACANSSMSIIPMPHASGWCRITCRPIRPAPSMRPSHPPKPGEFCAAWNSTTPPSTPVGSIWSRSRSACCAASASTAESTTQTGSAAKSTPGNANETPAAPAAIGCSQPTKPAPKWAALIPPHPKSHNHSGEVLVRWGHPHEIMRVGIVELKPRPLVQHVGIDLLGAQQRHALLIPGALALELRQLARQRDDLLVEFLAGVETVFAGIGVDAEIADDGRRHRIEGETSQDRFQARAGDHFGKMGQLG